MSSSYSSEFKQNAVKLAVESDQSVAQTARDLGVNANTLYTWITKYQQPDSAPTNKGQNKPFPLFFFHERMNECGLELHPEKTKLVYCKDYRRRDNYPVVKFDFLGYSFQSLTTKSRKTGKLFLGYDCAISISSKKRIADQMEELNIVGLT